MIRGDVIICGTSSTGTGTLTLAATPVPPGGVDFDVFARATGMGFGNSAAILVSYTIIEYTDSTFSTPKQQEKGVGTLTLGSSSGIANATLARTTLQTSATSLNVQPASQSIAPATGINITVASNTLVFIGVSAADLLGCQPYIQATAVSADTLGALPASAGGIIGNFPITNGDEYHSFVEWRVPMLAKRASFKTSNGTISGATMSAYARIYDVNSSGLPGKLLYDFGQIGNSAALQAQFTAYSTGASGPGFFLTPGLYYFSAFFSWTGGSGTLIMVGLQPVVPGNAGSGGFQPNAAFLATGGSAGAAPDPANTTGLAGAAQNPDVIISMMIASS